MAPERRRSHGHQQQDCRGGQRESRREPAPRAVPERQRARGEPQRQQTPGGEPPDARGGEPWQQAESSGQRTGDRADRVRSVRETDLAAEPLAPTAEQRDEHRELISRHNRRR